MFLAMLAIAAVNRALTPRLFAGGEGPVGVAAMRTTTITEVVIGALILLLSRCSARAARQRGWSGIVDGSQNREPKGMRSVKDHALHFGKS